MFKKLRGLLESIWTPLFTSGTIAMVDALFVEPDRLRVRKVRVPANRNAGQLTGVRLAQLSDLHVGGQFWRPATLLKAIDHCNRAELDLLVITGDFIGSRSGAAAALDLLSLLRTDIPRLAVLGNHDHVHGTIPAKTLIGGLRDLGIVLLNNEATALELPGGRVWVVGVDDGYTQRDDLGLAMSGLGPRDYPRILLTHYPDVADRLRPGEVQLSLSGHTHGGQVRLPVLTRLVYNGHARSRYGAGLYWVNGNPLYVNSGLGMSGMPMRFRNWPELTFLSFISSAEAAEAAPEGQVVKSAPAAEPGRNGHSAPVRSRT